LIQPKGMNFCEEEKIWEFRVILRSLKDVSHQIFRVVLSCINSTRPV
jgi:hypothetical protein